MAPPGNPWVLLGINAVLSGIFSSVVVWGLGFLGVVSFSWRLVGTATLLLMAVTYLVVLR